MKELETDVHMTQDDAVAGTPAYIAPEAISAPASIGPAADLYALGAVAYWMLTGRPVFVGKTLVAVFAAHLHKEPTAPSLHVEGIPEPLDRLVLRCLAKDPGARPASARDLVRMLGEVREAEALEWTAAERHAWWDAFERDRATPVVEPVDAAHATFTVDARRGGDVPIDAPGIDALGETAVRGRAARNRATN